MIYSPCRNCEKQNQPKTQCLQNCKLIAAVQEEDLKHASFQNSVEAWEEFRVAHTRASLEMNR